MNTENNQENAIENNSLENLPNSDQNHDQNITIGQLFKSTREAKELTIKVISQQTKIHIGLLEHLENDDLEKLPSKTYVRGFVKSAAKILGIKQDYALDILDQTYNKKGVAKLSKIYHAPPPENSLSNNFEKKTSISFDGLKVVLITYATTILKFGLAIALVVVVGINLKNYISNSNDEGKLKLPTVLTTIHQKVKPAPKPIVAKVETKPENVEPIKVNLIEDNKKINPEKSEIQVKDMKLKSVSNLEKQFIIDNKVLSKDEYETLLPSRFRVNPSKGVETVFVNAFEGDSWITYKIDDKEIKKYVLRQGRTVFMRGSNIRLFIGNTKNVKVFYNNQLIDLNTTSIVKNLVFPEELKTKYMNPLFVFQKDGTVITSDEFVKVNKEPIPQTSLPSPKR